MSEQFGMKIVEYIDTIAKNIGVASEYVFSMLVKQMVIEGVVELTTALFGTLVIYYTIYRIIKHLFDEDRDYGDEVKYPISILCCIFAVVIFIINLALTPENMMKIFNPEYYALKMILEAVK
jgi:uncharacterized Fe-S radical SAM superfamily protein PflX